MLEFTNEQKIVIAKLLAVQGVNVLLNDGLQVTNLMMEKLFDGYLKDIMTDNLIQDSVECYNKILENEQQTK